MIRNAVRHTAAGTTVRVAPCVNHDGSLLAVVITDQGPGVDHHRLHSIFQPFERGASEAGAGFGLGLAIALHALEMHGGTIAARNQAGGGGGAGRGNQSAAHAIFARYYIGLTVLYLPPH